MMARTAPNMLEYKDRLENAGFSSEQADAQTRCIFSLIEGKLMTQEAFEMFKKEEFIPFRKEFNNFRKEVSNRFDHIDDKFDQMEDKFDNKLDNVRSELKLWTASVMIGGIGFISSLMVLLHVIK